VAADDAKKGKKAGSRGKKNRMTEAEEDAQMLKSAQSKRRVIRLDHQPALLADHCKMHPYQLEGLNWLIKLHCNGINGILADEVSENYGISTNIRIRIFRSLNANSMNLFLSLHRWDWEKHSRQSPFWPIFVKTVESGAPTWSLFQRV
jgi:hypothetical protein